MDEEIKRNDTRNMRLWMFGFIAAVCLCFFIKRTNSVERINVKVYLNLWFLWEDIKISSFLMTSDI